MPKNIYLGLIKLTRLMLGVSKNVKISSGNTIVYANTTSITGATVTYNNATYDGTTKIATNIVVTLNGVTLTKDVDYIVVNNGGTNAGDYTFTIEGIGEYDNYIVKTFTISKVTPTVTAPTAKTLTYSGSSQTLTNAGSTNFGTLQYSSDNSTWSTTIPTGTNAGSYTVYYRVVGNSNVNDIASSYITCSISKVTPTVTAPTAKTLTYSGSAQTLANAGSTNFGTLQYSSDNSTWSTTIPTGTDASTNYKVYYRVVGNSNINDVASAYISCSISKVTPTVTAPTAKVLTYNGSAQSLVNAGSTNFGTLQYSSDNSTWSTTIPTGTNAGSYTVYYKVVGDSNVNDVASSYITCSIGAKSVTATVTLSQSSYTYSGSECKPTVTVKDGTTTISSSEYTITYSNNVNAGTATITISDNTRGNYTVSGSKTFTISKVTPTVTAPTAKTLTYSGSAQTLAYAGSTNFGTLQYSSDNSTWDTTIPTGTDVSSTYKVYYRVVGNSNVNDVASSYITCSISKVTPTVTAPTAKTLTYSVSAQTLANAGSTNFGTLQYSSDNSTWSTTIPTGTNAGSYTVYYKVVGNSNINDVTSKSISCSIGAKSVTATVTLSQSSYTYSGSECKPTVTVKDGTTTISSSEYTVSYSNNINVGTATVTITDNTGGNYTVSGSKTFTISKVTPTVTAPTAKTLTYSGSAQTLANAGSTNFGTLQYSSDNSTWSTTIPTGTDVSSTYKVYYRVVGNSNVNDVASSYITCSISKVTPTVTAPTAKVLTYNGSAQALVNAGSTNFGTLKYSTDNSTWSTSVPTATNHTAAGYSVYYKVDGDSNINNVTFETPVSCNINEKKVTATVTLSQSSYTYSGSECKPTVTVKDGTTTISASEYTVSYSNNVNAGTATVTISDNAHGNYEVIGSTTFTINQREVTLSWGTVTWTYDKTAHSTTCTAGNLVSGDTCTVTLTGNSITNKGTTTVTASSLSNNNYKLPSSKTNTLTINARTVTLNWGTTSWTYDGTAHSTTCTAGNLCSGDTCTVTLTGNSITDAGSTTVTASSLSNSNYALPSSKSTTLTVGAKTVSLNWGTTSWTYDGTAHSTTCTAGNLVSGDTCTVTLTGNSITNKGTTTVTASSLSNSNYKLPSTNTTTLTVNAKTVSLNWGTITWTYNAESHSTTCTAGSLVSGDTCTVTLTGNSITNKGTTTVTASSLSNSNYALPSSKTNTLTINARPINITAGSNSKTYDGTALSYNSATAESTGTNRGLVSGHSMTSCTVTGSITTVGSANNVPSAAVIKNGSGTEVTSNYSITYVNGTLTINAYTPAVTLSATNRAYNGNALYATATVSKPSNGKAISGTIYYGTSSGATTYSVSYSGSSVNLSSVSVTNVGSTTVYAYFVPDSTCSGVYNNSGNASKTLTVSKASQSAPTATGASTTYPTTATATASGGGGQGSIEWYNGSSRSSIGTQTTKARWSGNSNYNASSYSNEVTLSVSKYTPTVTLSATNRAYNGNALYATASISTPSGGATMKGTIYYGTSSGAQTYSVTYSGSGSVNLSSVSVTNVGSTTVYAYFVPDSTCNGVYNSSGNASKTLTITQASGSISYSTTSVSKTYGNSAFTNTLTKTGDGSVTYSSSDTSVATVNSTSGQVSIVAAGSCTITATVTNGTNYAYSTKTASYTLSVAKATGYINASKTNRTYSRGSQVVGSVSSASGTYYLGFGSSTTSAPTSWGSANSSLSATTAGTYYIWAKCNSSSNYNAVSATYVGTATISKATPVLSTSPSLRTRLIYSGSAQYLLSGGAMKHSSSDTTAVSGSFTYDTGTNASTYSNPYWYFTPSDTTNYNSTNGYISGSVTIGQADGSVIISGVSYNYNGNSRNLASVSSNTGTMHYRLGTSGSWSTSIPTSTNASTYTVYWYMDSSTNYKGLHSSSSPSYVTTYIYKIDPTITNPTAKTGLVYNGSSQTLWNTGSNTTSGSFSYSYGTSAGTYSSASWTFVPTDTTNYNTKSGSASITISTKSLTITANNQTIQYGNSINTGTSYVTTSGLVSGDSLTSISLSASTSSVGTGTITPSGASTSKGASNYSISYNTGTLTINKREITITAKAQTINYGSSISTGTSYVTTSGLGNFTLNSITLTASRSTAGTGTITPSDAVIKSGSTTITSSCSITYNTGTLTINKASQSAPTASVSAATYPSSSTASASGGGGQGSIEWSNGSSRSSIGTQTTKARWSGNSNYNASSYSNEVTLSVSKYTPTVTLSATNRAYNGNALYATATVSKPSNGKAISGTIYYGTSSGATTYSVSYSGSSVNLSSVSVTNVGETTVYAYFVPDSTCNGVYNSSGNASKTFSVSKASQSAPTASVSAATYPSSSTASASGGGGQGSIEWSNGSSRSSIGTQTTKARWSGNSNYNASSYSNEVTLSVSKYTPTVTLSATNRAYNGNALYATASISTPSGGAAMKGTIYYGTSSGAQTYSVTYSGSGSVNLSSVSVTNVGSATVYAYFVPDSTCNGVYNSSGNASKTFSVSKANQSAPTATGASTTYPTTATASASGGGGQGTLTWTNGNSQTGTSVGSKTTKAYWAGNSNYNASSYSNEVTLSVSKYTPTVTLSVTNRAYNGNALYATATVSTPSGGATAKGTIYYGTSSGATTYSVSYSGSSVNLSSVSVTNVGETTVYAYFVPDSTCNGVYNSSGNASKTFSVSKANQSAPTASVTAATYPNASTASASGGGGQGSIEWYNGSSNSTVGTTAKTKARWSGNSNYNASPYSNEVQFSVSARSTTVTASSTSKTYDGSALTYNSATASNLVSGHTMTCTVSGSQTNAGASANVPSAATIKDANGNNVTSNYSISYANGTLTVNKATPVTNLIVQQTTYPTTAYVYFYSNVAGKIYETWNGTQLTASNYSSSSQRNVSVTAGNGSSTNVCTVDSGTYVNSWTIYTYFVPTDTTNYNAVAGGPKTLSMSRASANTGTVSNPSAVTYNHDSSQTVQLGITGASGTVTFPTSISVTKSNSSVSGWTCTSAGVVTIPANTPTGSYTISGTISVAASTNYNSGSASKTWTVTVNAKSISIPTPANASKTYNGTSATATFYGAEGANVTKYRYSTNNSTWTETTTNPSITNVGTLYAQAYYSASDNYTGSNWSASATITVNKATPTTNLVVQQTTYPTTAYVYFYSNVAGKVYETSNGIQLTSSNYTSAERNASVTAGNGSSTNACTVDWAGSCNSWTIYTYFVPTDTTNYNAVAGGPKTLSMSKASANTGTVLNPSAVTYNHDSSQTVKLGITGGLSGAVTYPTSISVTKSNSSVSGWTCTDTGFVTIPANTSIGSYIISGTLYVSESPNYNSGSASKTWTVTVNAKSISIPTPTSVSKTYDGTAAAATFYGTEGANVTKYRYSTDNSTWTETTTNLSMINAGTIYVQAYYSASDNYTGSNWSESATITISRAGISFSVSLSGWTYGNTANNPSVSRNPGDGTVTYRYKVQGDDNSSWTSTKPSNAGNYTVEAEIGRTYNYWGANATADFTIAQREVTLNWGTITWTYDKTAHSTTCTAGNLVSGDTCTVTLTGNSITNKGTTTVTASSLSNSNYKLPSSKTNTLTINARTVTVNWGITSWTYDGSSHSTSVLLDNIITGDSCTATLTNNSVGPNVGTATCSINSLSNSNYTFNRLDASALLQIVKANPSYTAPTAKTGLKYSNSAHALLNAGSTSHGTIYYSSDNSSWSTTIPTGTNAGSYTVYWKLTGDSNHNNVNSTSINNIIEKATSSISITGKTLRNNGSSQQLASVTSVSGGTAYFRLGTYGSFSTTIPSATNSGTYTVYYYVSPVNSNYTGVASSSSPLSVTSTIKASWTSYLSGSATGTAHKDPQVEIYVSPSIWTSSNKNYTYFIPEYDMVMVITATSDSLAKQLNKYSVVGTYYAGEQYALTKSGNDFYLPTVRKKGKVPEAWIDGDQVEVACIVPELTSSLNDGAKIGTTNLGDVYLDGNTGYEVECTGLKRTNNQWVHGFFEEKTCDINGYKLEQTLFDIK